MHVLGFFAVWLAVAGFLWVSCLWAPAQIDVLRQLNAQLPALTVLGISVAQTAQAWSWPIVLALVIYTIVHLIALRSVVGLIFGLVTATILSVITIAIYIGIKLPLLELQKQLS